MGMLRDGYLAKTPWEKLSENMQRMMIILYLKYSDVVINLDTSDVMVLGQYFSDRSISLKEALLKIKKLPL